MVFVLLLQLFVAAVGVAVVAFAVVTIVALLLFVVGCLIVCCCLILGFRTSSLPSRFLGLM